MKSDGSISVVTASASPCNKSALRGTLVTISTANPPALNRDPWRPARAVTAPVGYAKTTMTGRGTGLRCGGAGMPCPSYNVSTPTTPSAATRISARRRRMKRQRKSSAVDLAHRRVCKRRLLGGRPGAEVLQRGGRRQFHLGNIFRLVSWLFNLVVPDPDNLSLNENRAVLGRP